MAQYLPLPDGTSVTIREGETPSQAWARAQQMYPEAFGAAAPQAGPGPESGFTPALKAGYSELKSGLAALAGKTGLMDPAAASQYIKEQEEYQQRTFKPTATFGEAPLTKTAELFGGSLPYMAAPLVAGTAVAAAPLTGTAATLAGLGAAGAASATQFTGSNIRRQMEEGKALEETSLGSAALAALPQAALDTLSLKMMPGIRGIFSAAGKEVSAPVAKRIAEQGLSQAAKDYALATGKTMGVEGATEAAQQVFERLQAGLNITDEKARAEYLDSLIGGAVLGGVLAPGGRYLERRGEAKQQEGERLAKAFEERQAQQAELAKQSQFRASPEGALQFVEDYEARQARFQELKQVKKPGADATPLERAEFDDVKKERNALNKSLFQDSAEYKKAKTTAQDLLEQRRLEQLSPEDVMLEHLGVGQPKAVSAQGAAEPVKMRTVIDGMGRITEVPEGYEAAPEPDAAQKYLTGQIEAARNVGQVSLADFADYAMQDPAMARVAVDNAARVPGLSASENRTLLAGINLRLKAIEDERKAAAKAATTSAMQRLGSLEEQERTTVEEQRLEEAKARAAATQEALQAKGTIGEMQTQMRIAPEIEAIRRLGKVPEDSFSEANAVAARERMAQREKDAELAQRLVETLPVATVKQPPGRTEAGRAAPKARRSELLAKLEIARATRNKYAIRETQTALDDLDQAEEVGGRAEFALEPDVIKALSGVEAPAAVQQQEQVGAAVDAQNSALVRAVRSLEDARRIGQNILPEAFYKRLENAKAVLDERLQDPKATKESRAAAQKAYDDLKRAFSLQRRGQTKLVLPEKLQAQVQQARMDYLNAHMDELASHYASYDLPPPADWEKGEARARVMEAFNELENRWDVFGAPMQAVDVLQDQMRQNINTSVANALKRQRQETAAKLAGPKTEGLRVGAKELKLRGEAKVETDDKKAALELIDRLLATLETRTRAVPTAAVKPEAKVKDLADLAKLFRDEQSTGVTEKTSPEVANFLTRVRDALEISTDPELASLAREQAQRVYEGNIPDPFAVREIDDIIRAQKAAAASETRPGATPEELQRTSAQTQQVLFPEAEVAVTRATPQNFQRMLDSKDIQGLRKAIAQQQADNIDVLKQVQERLPGSQKSITRAEARTKQALEKAKELGQSTATITDEVKKEWADAARELVAAESAVQSIPKRIAYLKDIQTSLEGLNKSGKETLMELINEALRFVNNPANPTALRDSLEAKEFVELKQWMDPAKSAAEIKRLNSLYLQAKKALEPARARLNAALEKYDQDSSIRESLGREHEKALNAVKRAQEEERTAKQVASQEEKEAKAAKDAALATDRAYREALVRAQAGMGLPGRRIEVDTAEQRRQEANIRRAMGSLQEQVDTAKTDAKRQEAQEKYIAKEQELEQLYEKAPRKETVIKEEGEQLVGKSFEESAAAKQAGVEARRRTREKEAAPALPSRTRGQLMRQGNTQRVVQTGVRKTTRAIEIAAELMEKKAATQADIKAVQDQMQRLRDSGKDKVKNRYTPLFKSLQEKEAALKARNARITELHRRAIEAQGGKKFVGAPEYTEAGAEAQGEALPVSDEIAARDARMERVFNIKADSTSPYHGKTYAEAAALAADNATDPVTKELFKLLAKSLRDHPVHDMHGRVFITNKAGFNAERALDRVTGLYDAALNLVIAPSPTLSADAETVLLHELSHVATFAGLQKDAYLKGRVTNLRNRVDAWLKTPEGKAYYEANKTAISYGTAEGHAAYGLTDNFEFLAEVYSNGAFRQMLRQIPSDTPRRSVWQRLVDVFADFLNLRGDAQRSLLEDALEVTDRTMAATETIKAAEKEAKQAALAANKPLTFRAPRYNDNMGTVGDDISKIVAQQRPWSQRIKANTTGLAFETQLVDRFAGFERLAKYMEPLKGSQMMYYLRMYDQRMNFVSQAVSNGALQVVEKTRADGKKEYVIESTEGASIANVVQTLADAQKYVGNAEAVNQLFTTYLAALRADRVGLDALNFGEEVTQDMLDRARSTVENNKELLDVFTRARNEYNAYNRNMINFVASTGAISQETADRLSRTNDYIPFYREQNGVAQLMIGGEAPIRVGSIAEQPYLQELMGGDQAILDFMTSSVQNTNMLADMALRNLATKNAVFELMDLGAAKIVKHAEGRDVVKFKVDGKDRYAVMSTERVKIGNQEFDTGVPADLLVKGMEGIPVQMPALLRALAMPSQLLRKAVTLSPLYMAKQLFRDSLAAPLLSGADFTPVIGALRQIGAPTKGILERRGVVGGQMLQGTTEDMTKILRDLADGKPGWQVALGKLEAMGMEADALTRRAQYNSYIEQGMSEMEATLMALESMNFNKRGASPSIHMANALIPFFNAQIQGLNVLYKALWGKMPANDKLKIRQKMLQRGAMMAAATLVYAAMMEDDEAYKNATPDQKYGNWFIRVPGVDEPVRLPIPFEIGYIFKALPEALYNSMTSEHGGEEAVKAFRQILLQTIPGGSSYGIPQALKPAIEAGLGKSFYTGRDILSAREKDLLPEEQFRANTSELAKAFGKELGVSPVAFEYLVRGYTGTVGLAFLHALSVGMPKSDSPEAAAKRLSDYPIVGGAVQPNDAGGIINNVYERMNEDIKVRDTYKKMLTEGRTAAANELLQRRGNEIMEAELGDHFKNTMNKLTQAERAVQASNMSPEEKRKQLDELRKLKTAYANTARTVGDKMVSVH